MRLAIELAAKGEGYTSPNPMVGAVVVKEGRIIGKGYHEKYGSPHAERNALASCSESPKGADIYVTLEPCCHYGKQPPCTDALIEAGIARVFAGSPDPNPKVAGKGFSILREEGIEVVENVLRDECDALNPVFFHYIKTNRPFVILKYAMTIDGKIACFTGKSKWVTGEKARAHVHSQRHKYSSVLVGSQTVLEDDPMLNCRMEGGCNPVRIVADSRLRTPLTSQLVETARDIPLIIATSKRKDETSAYEKKGCKILTIGEKEGHIDLQELLLKLGEEKIDSLILEGGGTLTWSFVKNGLVDKVQAYIAPKIFGGKDAKTPVEGFGFEDPSKALVLGEPVITKLGTDILMEFDVIK